MTLKRESGRFCCINIRALVKRRPRQREGVTDETVFFPEEFVNTSQEQNGRNNNTRRRACQTNQISKMRFSSLISRTNLVLRTLVAAVKKWAAVGAEDVGRLPVLAWPTGSTPIRSRALALHQKIGRYYPHD